MKLQIMKCNFEILFSQTYIQVYVRNILSMQISFKIQCFLLTIYVLMLRVPYKIIS